MGTGDRRRRGDNVEIGLRQRGGIGGVANRCGSQFGGAQFAGSIVAPAQCFDAAMIDVVTDHRHARAGECHRHGQADVAETDDGDAAAMQAGGAHPVIGTGGGAG